MTAHFIKGQIAFSCDTCTETITPTAQEKFGSVWAEAQSKGWHAFLSDDGTWEHLCPDCARAEAESPE